MIDIKDITYSPGLEELSNYIGIPLFKDFCNYMDFKYEAICKIEYSKDSLLKGWNIKFRKKGKALCVAYPKDKYFTVLVVIGKREKERAESLLPQLTETIQSIYERTKEGMGQKWLMIDVDSDDNAYQDLLKLIDIRL